MSVASSIKKSLAIGASAVTLSTMLTALPAESAGTVKCGGQAATIVGTPGQDILRGTPGRDVINGLGGSDTIQGFGGNDVICGAAGNDTIFGHGGNDIIIGGPGNDNIFGNTGNNKIYAGPGNDEIITDAGKDRVWAGAGNDEINTKSGNDVVYGQGGDDTVYGGYGNDYVNGGAGDDRIYAGPGADVMLGGGNGSRLDYCVGGTGNDRSNGCERRTQQWASFFVPSLRNPVETEMWNRVFDRRTQEGVRRSWQSPEDRAFADNAAQQMKAVRAAKPGQSSYVFTLGGGAQKFGSWGYRCDVVEGLSPDRLVDIMIAQIVNNETAPFDQRRQWYDREGDRLAVSADTTSDPNCFYWAVTHESPVAPPTS